MKEHSITWYESEDGEIFLDEMECVSHEAALLYNKSGVRFYAHDWMPIDFDTVDDYTYNACNFIVIDRKNENNKRFVDYMYYEFGWCLLKEAYDMDGDTFAIEISEVIPVSSHLVY